MFFKVLILSLEDGPQLVLSSFCYCTMYSGNQKNYWTMYSAKETKFYFLKASVLGEEAGSK